MDCQSKSTLDDATKGTLTQRKKEEGGGVNDREKKTKRTSLMPTKFVWYNERAPPRVEKTAVGWPAERKRREKNHDRLG